MCWLITRRCEEKFVDTSRPPPSRRPAQNVVNLTWMEIEREKIYRTRPFPPGKPTPVYGRMSNLAARNFRSCKPGSLFTTLCRDSAQTFAVPNRQPRLNTGRQPCLCYQDGYGVVLGGINMEQPGNWAKSG